HIKRGPSLEDPLLGRKLWLFGGCGCARLAVVDAVPEGDVALRDPVQDLVRLRLCDLLLIDERFQPRLDADCELGGELVLGHAAVLGQVADLLALPQVLAKLRRRDVKDVRLGLEDRERDRAAVRARVGLRRGGRGRRGRFGGGVGRGGGGWGVGVGAGGAACARTPATPRLSRAAAVPAPIVLTAS